MRSRLFVHVYYGGFRLVVLYLFAFDGILPKIVRKKPFLLGYRR